MGVLTTITNALGINRPTPPAGAAHDVEILRESVADLELALEDSGWRRLTAQGENEFSHQGLLAAARVSRVMAVQHPLIKRGLAVRQAYVWGQGVTIAARSTGGDDGGQDVNSVVQAFLDDPGNQTAVTGDQAREELERALGTDGNVFIACVTNPKTGRVQVRTVPFDEMSDVVTNPDDRTEPWLYLREWDETRVDLGTGRTAHVTGRRAYYPASGYYPTRRPTTLNGAPVMWDTPIVHVAVNRLTGWKFGVGDAYAALTWARAYRDFLTDWAVLVKSLSQFAWRATSGGSRAQRLREQLARRPTPTIDGNPNSAGATALLPDGTTLEAIPKSGATIDSESGRPLAAMIAAALDVPVTTLLADPGTTGARAVAETLNKPTRLAFQQRQGLWGETYRTILGIVIRAAVEAPQGALTGTITHDGHTRTTTLTGDTDATIEIVWPTLEDNVPVDQLVDAITKADATMKLPPLETLKLLLKALGVSDPDEIIASVTTDAGEWLDPYASAGQAAVDAFRRGEDPAWAVT